MVEVIRSATSVMCVSNQTGSNLMNSIGAIVAVIKDGQILLTKREDFEVWCLPGGSVEDGEPLATTAVREVFEETGLHVCLDKLVGIYSIVQPGRGLYAAAFTAVSYTHLRAHETRHD